MHQQQQLSPVGVNEKGKAHGVLNSAASHLHTGLLNDGNHLFLGTVYSFFLSSAVGSLWAVDGMTDALLCALVF